MNNHNLKKYRCSGKSILLSMLLLMLMVLSTSEVAWAQKMKRYAISLAKQCYPNERIINSTESARLGTNKVTYGAKVFLTHGIEMHFVMHFENVSKGLNELVIDDAQCIEKGVKGPCSCPAIEIGSPLPSGDESSSNAVFVEENDSTVKKASKSINLNQLKSYIGKSVCIEMKNGDMHENAVITEMEGNQISITEFKYGGQISQHVSLDDVKQVLSP